MPPWPGSRRRSPGSTARAASVWKPSSPTSTSISEPSSAASSAAAGRTCASWDRDDPLAAGLELDACPPGKKLTGIGLLSGGEKTLTALALVFAFFLAAPSPLCVLDEVDAPLDDANVDRFVDLMREIAAETGTRFLVVTHHPLTMARTDRLYGVTMSERGQSRLVSVALEEAAPHASA